MPKEQHSEELKAWFKKNCSKAGKASGAARRKNFSPARLSEIASIAGKARWAKERAKAASKA